MSNEIEDSMMTKLHAYVDGEMDDAARAAFEAKLGQDLHLQDALSRELRLRELLGSAYAPVLAEPVPDRLSALLMKTKPQAEVVSLAEVRARRSLGWAQWGGMAASLMLGTLLGSKLLPDGGDQTAQMVDGSVLAQALDQQLSGQSIGNITPGLSFVAKGGVYCRSFTSAGAQASAGLACRDGQQWQLRRLEPLPPTDAASGGYRTAAAALPTALLQSIDALREGDALDAEAELQARARRWQPAQQ